MERWAWNLYLGAVLIAGVMLALGFGGDAMKWIGTVLLWSSPFWLFLNAVQGQREARKRPQGALHVWRSKGPQSSYPPLSPGLRRLLEVPPSPVSPPAPATGKAPPTLGSLLAVALILAASLLPLPALAEPPEPPAPPVAPLTPAERGMGQIEGGIGLLGVSAVLAFPMAGLLATPAFGGAERQAPVIGTLLVVGVLSAIGGVWELTSGLHLRSGHAPASGSVRGRFLGLGWTLPNAENSGSGLFSLAWSL